MTKEKILDINGFDFDAFKYENEYSAKNLLLAMKEYAQQESEKAFNASREVASSDDKHFTIYKYPTFKDYENRK